MVVVVPEELELLDESSFFAQEMRVRLKRNMEKMMSICLTWFPFGGLREPIYTRTWFVLQCVGDFTWRVSDCEEIVGFTHRGMMGVIGEILLGG